MLCAGHDEELRVERPRGIRSGLRGRDRPDGVMVLRQFPDDRMSVRLGRVAARSAALDHEVLHHSMPAGSVVNAGLREKDEATGALRVVLRVERQDDVSLVRLDGRGDAARGHCRRRADGDRLLLVVATHEAEDQDHHHEHPDRDRRVADRAIAPPSLHRGLARLPGEAGVLLFPLAFVCCRHGR